jgi:hypothetical protein
VAPAPEPGAAAARAAEGESLAGATGLLAAWRRRQSNPREDKALGNPRQDALQAYQAHCLQQRLRNTAANTFCSRVYLPYTNVEKADGSKFTVSNVSCVRQDTLEVAWRRHG